MHFCRVNPSRASFRRRRMVACLVILALLGVLLMPMTGAFAAWPEGVTLVTVCTDHGAQLVALDDEGESVPLKKAHDHGRACPFCLSYSGGVLAALPTVLLVLPVASGREIGVPMPAGIFPEAVFLTGRQSRAPPAAML